MWVRQGFKRCGWKSRLLFAIVEVVSVPKLLKKICLISTAFLLAIVAFCAYGQSSSVGQATAWFCRVRVNRSSSSFGSSQTILCLVKHSNFLSHHQFCPGCLWQSCPGWLVSIGQAVSHTSWKGSRASKVTSGHPCQSQWMNVLTIMCFLQFFCCFIQGSVSYISNSSTDSRAGYLWVLKLLDIPSS